MKKRDAEMRPLVFNILFVPKQSMVIALPGLSKNEISELFELLVNFTKSVELYAAF